MTIEELLESDPETLERMTDEEMKTFFAPYLIYVKPSAEMKFSCGSSKLSSFERNPTPSLDHNLEKAKALAKQLGIDFDKL